jgi:hypothetical protein
MRQECGGARAVLVIGVIGALALLALATPAAALNVSSCLDLTTTGNNPTGDTNIIVTADFAASAAGATCLTVPRNAVVQLNGHLISGFGQDDSGSVGIDASKGDAFILGPGIVKGFGTCILAGDHVAVEDLLTNQCATGIKAGRSYKIKEVRVHDCTSSNGPNIGIDLDESAGGFIESSIVRACDFGVITGKNNKIWNLVVSFHNDVGLEVGGGTAVSRTVISTPASTSTIGLQYSDCCQFAAGALLPNGQSGQEREGCQDGSNSVQDHLPGLNITLSEDDGGDLESCDPVVVTDGHTNCGGAAVPTEIGSGNGDDSTIAANC